MGRPATGRRCLAALPPDTFPEPPRDADEFGGITGIFMKEPFCPEERAAAGTAERGQSHRREGTKSPPEPGTAGMVVALDTAGERRV